jgi:hypothetical protein
MIEGKQDIGENLREYFSFVASLLDVSSLLTGWDGRRNGDLPQTTCFLIVLLNMEIAIPAKALREETLKRVLNRITIVIPWR